MSKQLVNYQST